MLNDLVLLGYNELSPGHIDFRIYTQRNGGA